MAKKEHNAEKGFECLTVTAVQVSPFREGEKGKILAYASVVLNDQLTIRSMRVMDGVNGLYVAYPTDPFYKGDTYRCIVCPITRELREHIENCVLEKYQYEMGKETLKFDVELTHQYLAGASMKMEIIATSKNEAMSKAKEKAIEINPLTKYNGDWAIIKVEKHE